MAFNKTDRFAKLITATPTRVGPGTYDVPDLSKPPRDLSNAYPFLSGSSRKIVSIPRDAHKFPGPGSYNIETSRKHIPERAFLLHMCIRYFSRFNDSQGGASINYTDVRFKRTISKDSGSSEYILLDDLLKETPRKLRSHPSTWQGPDGKLWLTRPPRSIMPTGIAVPTKRDTGGYDFDEHGMLVKNLVIEPKTTDFYEVPRGETNFATLRYKGNFWSRMKGRDDGRTSVTPGPGDYEHETKKTPVQIHDERIREAKRAAAKLPRFLEALYQQKLRQNFPASNYYDPPKSVFDRYKEVRCKCVPRKKQPPSFNQSAVRFEENVRSDELGPGAYEVTRLQSCHGSIYHAPFGAFSARIIKLVDSITPGPGHYHTDMGNLAFESRKRFKDKQRRMINDTDIDKISESISDDDEYMSGDEYEIEEEGKCPVYHAVFKSRVNRFPQISRNSSDIPDPGAYETLSAFKINRDRCDFLCRRLAPPFGSRVSRFPVIRRDVDFHVPGPSQYDVRGDISKYAKGGVICYAPREKKEDVKGPSPVHYYIHPYIASSVLKKSFNVSLGKPKIIKNLKKIQNSWYHRRSKKVLRWFTAPRKEYQHCTSISY